MGGHLKRGTTVSCGCYQKKRSSERLKGAATTHGRSTAGDPTYKAWKRMKHRCYQPAAKTYPSYGGRGIEVCERWRDSFENFLADMGERPEGTTLDRIDTDGDYEPGNCRWATRREQDGNKSNSIRVTVGDRTMCLYHWAEKLGINANTLYYRYRVGKWP